MAYNFCAANGNRKATRRQCYSIFRALGKVTHTLAATSSVDSAATANRHSIGKGLIIGRFAELFGGLSRFRGRLSPSLSTTDLRFLSSIHLLPTLAFLPNPPRVTNEKHHGLELHPSPASLRRLGCCHPPSTQFLFGVP